MLEMPFERPQFQTFSGGGELSPAPQEGLCPQHALHLEAAMKWAVLNFLRMTPATHYCTVYLE